MQQTREEFLNLFIRANPTYEIKQIITRTCEKHGEHTNHQLVQTLDDGTKHLLPLMGCPRCRDEENIRNSVRMHETDVTDERILSAGIPKKHLGCTLRGFVVDDDPQHEEAKRIVRSKAMDFITEKIRSLVLLGGTGLGKTHLVASMLKGCAREGMSALYTTERKIYREIHESYLGRKDLPTEGQVIAKYSNADVLGIDEIGRASWTEHEAQILYEIIDNRDGDGKKTVMSGNITPDEFREKFDDSFRRKLDAHIVICRWDQYQGGNA